MLLDKRILDIPGWMKENELEWLMKTAATLPMGSMIVEIGAFCGRSTMALCQGADVSESTVITIDPFDDEAMKQLPEWHTEITCMYDCFRETMDKVGYWPVVLMATSLEVAKLIPDNYIGMVFIDGLHTATGDDIDAWLPKMKAGGIMSGHDYGTGQWNVRGQVRARFSAVQAAAHSIWYVAL